MASVEEIIDEAKNGRMFILVDDEDRENEGDLVIPAQMATPAAINFMAKHGRGLICLSMSKARVDQLGLPMMSRQNGTRHETAFTVSIEAKDGVTTGISAADRARTIAVAIDAAKGPEHIVTPGHVFPLVARDGGVLVRAGHTEAAVDVARLAGLNPSGVICEIMNEDGTMARMDDLMAFAQLHGLKIGTIRDLIAYRRRTEQQVDLVSDVPFESAIAGPVRLKVYRSRLNSVEHAALVKGSISPERPTLVRMHRVDLATDLLARAGARRDLVASALAEISRYEGAAAAVFIQNEDPAGLSSSVCQTDASRTEGVALRDYGLGAQILVSLGVRQMILLTTSRARLAALEGYDLGIVERRQI